MSNANSRLDILKIISYTIASIFTFFAFITAILWKNQIPCKLLDLNKDNYSPTIYILAAIASFLFAIPKFIKWVGSSEKKMDRNQTDNQHNRKEMLKAVKSTWIEGFLNDSLHNQVLIRLGLERRKDLLNVSWNVLSQNDKQALPAGTKIIDVFEKTSQPLLILGEPGAGKTILLLELARDLIDKAEKKPNQKIPVVFNLSSWSKKQKVFSEWLIDELKNQYLIPKKIATAWIENDDLLLLLDGLDEVAKEHREACVNAINKFRYEHLVPLAVCSRIVDYEALKSKLKAGNVLQLKPLSQQQIDKYLNDIGIEFDGVRNTIKSDTDLQELVHYPLMLNITTLAYQGKSTENIQNIDINESRSAHLFRTYIQKMLTRRKNKKIYATERIIYWLRCIAQKMQKKAQTVFFLEDIQPDWLPNNKLFWAYKLSIIFFIMLSLELIYGTIGELFLGINVESNLGLSLGLSVGVSAELGSEVKKMLKVKSRGNLIDGLISMLIFGLIFGLIYELSYEPALRPIYGLIYGLRLGLIYGLIFGLSGKLKSEIDTVELLQWSREGISKNLISALNSGLIVGMILGLIFDSRVGLSVGISAGLIVGMNNWLKKRKITTKIIPNQGTKQSMKNFVLTICIYGASIGLIYGLIFEPGGGLIVGMIVGMIVGLNSGGGLAVIRHFVLRLILFLTGYIPWRYVRFLNDATEKIFLRKVGGGYIFIHRTIMEYFASLKTEDIKKIVSEID